MHFIATALFSGPLAGERLRVLDCGASGGGEAARWAFLGRAAEIHAFEADAGECARLQAEADAEGINCRYHPLFLGRTEKGRVLNIGEHQFSSSFLEPNLALLDRIKYPYQGQILRGGVASRVVRRVTVDTISLDDWASGAGIDEVDFAKIDIEGLELEVMEASPRILGTVLALYLDVVFNECWFGTPRLGDIDNFLAPRGFTLWDIARIKRYGKYASPISVGESALTRAGQAANGEALYVADPVADGARPTSPTRILKLAAIAEVMGQLEYAFELLVFLRERTASGEREAIERIIRDATRYYRFQDDRRVQIIRRLRQRVATGLPAPLLSLLRPLDRLLPFR
ncbi:MAG TPA: FkbM family methyltransferase [Stellaceae bacterium]|nr:FkbM family methyltransferase [Stellaceae bacterium]